MGVTALGAKLEVEVSRTELSDTGKGREDEDDVAECPDVDTDRVEKFDGIGGNVSRLLGSNTVNSPMSLTNCSVEALCCARPRTVCS